MPIVIHSSQCGKYKQQMFLSFNVLTKNGFNNFFKNYPTFPLGWVAWNLKKNLVCITKMHLLMFITRKNNVVLHITSIAHVSCIAL